MDDRVDTVDHLSEARLGEEVLPHSGPSGCLPREHPSRVHVRAIGWRLLKHHVRIRTSEAEG